MECCINYILDAVFVCIYLSDAAFMHIYIYIYTLDAVFMHVLDCVFMHILDAVFMHTWNVVLTGCCIGVYIY